MAYPYGTQGAPAVGTGSPGLPRRIDLRGELVFAIPGTYSVTVPDGVTSICGVVGAGGGGGWASATWEVSSGAGGALAWKNDIPVSPGQQITVVVGDGGLAGVTATPGTAGGTSYIIDTSTCAAGGGAGGATGVTAAGGAVLAGDGGGAGGNGANLNNSAGATSCSASAGAAGGYSGAGGSGVASAASVAGSAGTGGAGGSAGVFSGNLAGGSGGVGIFGEGASGAAGSAGGGSGTGGSGGQSGKVAQIAGIPGIFSAGGVATTIAASNTGIRTGFGASGFARIIWGAGRFFPSTDVGPS